MNILQRLFGKKNKPAPVVKPPVDTITVENNLEERVNKTVELLEEHKRTAYLPITSEHANTFSDRSKIGGFPYLRIAEDWPKCPNCQKHMQLFLQLNLEHIPERKDIGLIQLFYCTSKEPDCETALKAFFPFSSAVVCRKTTVNGASAIIQPVIESVFQEKLITGWEAKDDYPHVEEYESLGLDMDDEVLEIMDARGLGLTIDKDKLFGWPYWVQGVEYPLDRATNQPMELLFQLDSEDHLPFMFGDSGIGHLTQSPDNKEEMAFGWACY
ncbi:MAG TPA: DUF1963 domain-containing protein [Prolixibacteraceae bacterium]|nr:DUF1963 domain-containing protein [Prolixibacteraceae bacterium]